MAAHQLERRGRSIVHRKATRLILIGAAWVALAACEREAPSAADAEGAAPRAQADATAPAAAAQPETLTAQLEALTAQFAARAPGQGEGIAAAVGEIAATGILERAVNDGDQAPDFTLPDALGNAVNLNEELADGPVILTWYRGSWCPYCNLQLRDYQQALGEIRAAGAQLIAVSPELPDSTLSWQEKNELEFIVLSDVGNEVARQYGIVFRIPESIAANYRPGGYLDLAKVNGDDSMELPLAATYVIGTDGSVEYAFVDADWRKRADTAELVGVVERLAAN
jgi:peroxiredoxin